MLWPQRKTATTYPSASSNFTKNTMSRYVNIFHLCDLSFSELCGDVKHAAFRLFWSVRDWNSDKATEIPRQCLSFLVADFRLKMFKCIESLATAANWDSNLMPAAAKRAVISALDLPLLAEILHLWSRIHWNNEIKLPNTSNLKWHKMSSNASKTQPTRFWDSGGCHATPASGAANIVEVFAVHPPNAPRAAVLRHPSHGRPPGKSHSKIFPKGCTEITRNCSICSTLLIFRIFCPRSSDLCIFGTSLEEELRGPLE